MLEPGADPVRKVSIVPRGRALGVTFQSPSTDRYGYDARYLEGRIVGALGGRAAEELVYGNVTTGAESDLEQVTRIARQMVGRWGMSDVIGLVSVLPGARRGAVLGPGGPVQVSDETRELVDREVRRIVEDCYERARRMLRRQPRQARVADEGAARARDARRGRRLPRRRLRPRPDRRRRRRRPPSRAAGPARRGDRRPAAAATPWRLTRSSGASSARTSKSSSCVQTARSCVSAVAAMIASIAPARRALRACGGEQLPESQRDRLVVRKRDERPHAAQGLLPRALVRPRPGAMHADGELGDRRHRDAGVARRRRRSAGAPARRRTNTLVS